jgi:hypothetical protein
MSKGAAKMQMAVAANNAKKRLPRDGLKPSRRVKLTVVLLYQKLYHAFWGSFHHPIPLRPYSPSVNSLIKDLFH